MRLIILALLLCTACKSSTLSVHTEYFTRNDLASVIVDTPDPNKQEAIFGQRLYISWSLSKEQFAQKPVELACQIMLKKGQMIEKKIPVTQAFGTYVFPIVGQDFTKNGGLLSYQIKLVAADKVLATCRHKFWVEQIKISD
jgi:hypothetical protein